MIELGVLVRELKENKYDTLCEQMIETKADKCLLLTKCLKENELPEDQIANRLGISVNAYYTLKSRLYDRIQVILTTDLDDIKAKLLVSLSGIPDLFFETPRETSIAILKKLEQDLIEQDRPHELRVVYNALKKLHFNTPKYMEYTEKHDTYLACVVAIDRSEDLIVSFHGMLGDYLLSRDESLIGELYQLKNEMSSLARLHHSYHLNTYNTIIDLSFAIYIPSQDLAKEDLPVEDLLLNLKNHLVHYRPDKGHKHLVGIFHLFSFEYYLAIKQYKKAEPHFRIVNEMLPSFLNLSFYCFPSAFLLSKLNTAVLTFFV